MSVFKDYFPLGLGTARFPIHGPDDREGIEQSIQMVLRALELGVNYVDLGYTYSSGKSIAVLKEALQRTDRPFSITAKTACDEDKTAADARRRIESYLKTLGVDHIDFFTCWRIWSFEDFQHIMEPGGIYDAAVKLRDEGVIRHICCSLHAPPEDMKRIIESGAFEGVTISYSLLNAVRIQPVLDAAAQRDVGVAVMNPLGGGMIAQNRKFFSYACGPEDEGDTIRAALRFVKAHPAVDIVLGGVSSLEELEDSLTALSAPDPEPPSARLERVLQKSSGLKGFCTGCKYCEGCPKGIPTYALMQARNALLFEPVASYNRQGPDELLWNIQMFRKLYFDDSWMPDTGENPCVQCGRCEAACTQKLNIIEGAADVYRRAEQAGYTRTFHRQRLRELLNDHGYRRVGLYPSGVYAKEVIKTYRENFGEPDFEWLLFNSDRTIQGALDDGLTVHHADEIPALQPDVILICSYRFERDIAESLQPYERQGVRVKKLHREQDVPWVF